MSKFQLNVNVNGRNFLALAKLLIMRTSFAYVRGKFGLTTAIMSKLQSHENLGTLDTAWVGNSEDFT